MLKYLKFKVLKLHSVWLCKFNTWNSKYFNILVIKVKMAYLETMYKIEIPN
jgi:hypothetical protein